MHGFCNFAVFVHQKSKAPERVKRDPHLFDLVIFLHPKKCMRAAKSLLLLVLGRYGEASATAASWRANDGGRQRKTACPLLYR